VLIQLVVPTIQQSAVIDEAFRRIGQVRIIPPCRELQDLGDGSEAASETELRDADVRLPLEPLTKMLRGRKPDRTP
jgi:hypothetical protein